jgi:putative ABC transport system permease protein
VDSFRAEPFEVRVGEAIEKVNGASVTNAFFRETKVLPMLGRVFLDEEYQAASTPVVVIAASLWQRQFGGDPALIGKTLSVNQRQCTIVGILPKTFQFPTGAELWMPQNR